MEEVEVESVVEVEVEVEVDVEEEGEVEKVEEEMRKYMSHRFDLLLLSLLEPSKLRTYKRRRRSVSQS